MERPRLYPVRVVLLAVLVASASVRSAAADPPQGPDETWRLSVVQVDQGHGVSERYRRLREAMNAECWDEALEELLALSADHPRALVETPRATAGEVPLYRPVREVVQVLLGEFPPVWRHRAVEAWRGSARALLTRARAGDEEALVELGDAWGTTSAGAAALRTLAHRDLEAGCFARAATGLERWLALAVHASLEDRALALLELVDARAGLDDEAALESLLERFAAEASTTVSTGQGCMTPALRARTCRAEIRLRAGRAACAAGREANLPEEAVVLWTRALDREGVLQDEPQDASRRTTAGAATEGEDLFLHEGRVVRRIEAWTGREIWRFPPLRPGVWEHDEWSRYAQHDVPLRTVTLAGDLVLVVMGDPAGSGGYRFRGAEMRVKDVSRERRLRLVALEKSTGRLRWATGLPTDTHPVLGDPATGCHAPPLVVDRCVYAVFVRGCDASEIHLARLDLATGEPDWVTWLAVGESGLSSEVGEEEDRFAFTHLRAGPWGARPSFAHGEVCVVPHAGFAAGVDAVRGRVRWLRVLPRFSGGRRRAPYGFSGRNAPESHGAAWILAPMDCPRLVALEQGTGRWLWSRSFESDGIHAAWCHVLGTTSLVPGGPWLRLLGLEPSLLALSRPGADVHVGAFLDEFLARFPGRPLDLGSRFVVAGAVSSPDPSDVASSETRPVLLSVPWDPRPPHRVRPIVLEAGDFPRQGDVYRAGDVWVVVGPRRVGAVASFAAAGTWWAQRAADDAATRGERAAATALGARLGLNPEAALRALAQAVRSGDDAALDVVLTTAEMLLDREVQGVEVLGAALLDHAPSKGGDLLADLVGLDAMHRRPEALVALLDRWIEVGSDASTWSAPGVDVRCDLYAGLVLRSLRFDGAAAEALRARDARHAELVLRALDAPEADLREAIRRAVATPAANRGREAFEARLVAQGRFEEAAGVAADRRLDPSGRAGMDEGAARARLALLQAEEAYLLAAAHCPSRARRLLADLVRSSPESASRLPDARSPTVLSGDLARRSGWRPSDVPLVRFDAWAGLDAPSDAAAVRSVVFPGLVGPGAARRSDRLLVGRGLGVEVWSRAENRRIAAFEGAGSGWFGGSLAEVESWMPGGGVTVVSLVAREPADSAALLADDHIVSWNGVPVEGASHFMHLVASSPPGEPVPVRILRRGRPVLERFVAGRRPPGEGLVVERREVYASQDGRLLVPSRLDIAWVDPEAVTCERLWAWKGTGVVRAVDVGFGLAVVTVHRLREQDTVVGVDLATGEERWHTDVAGTVTSIEATGSAFVVHALDPSRVWVLDAWDGSTRVRFDVLERQVLERPQTLASAPTAVVAHGRVHAVVSDGTTWALRVLDTTTGSSRVRLLDTAGFEPLIAADGVVALATGSESLSLFALDPLTGEIAWTVEVAPDTEPSGWSLRSVDADARLHVVGDRLYIVRNGGVGEGISVEVVEVDLAAFGPREPHGAVWSGRALRPIAVRSVRRLPYLLDLQATPEGLLLSAGSRGNRSRRATFWTDRDGRTLLWRDPRGADEGVLQMWRSPPSRVGDLLAIPTDEGALFVPLVSGED